MKLPSVRHLLATTIALAVALPLSVAVSTAPAAAAAADDDVLRVLLFSSGDGVHGSVANTRAAVRELSNSLASEYGLDGNTNDPTKAVADIQETTDAAAFTPANLATKDVLVFAHTAGVLFTPAQRTALKDYMEAGGGFVGIHYTGWSPDQTEADVNPFYRKLIGASATGHPEPAGGQRGTVNVDDTPSPLTAGLPAQLSYTDEWYEWDVNPAQNVRTLVTVDESTFPAGTEVGEEGTTHPVTWCQSVEQGRSWYTSLGHHASAYTAADDGGNANDNEADNFIRDQLRSGMAYSAGLLPADCSPPAKDEQGTWSGITPWPVVPINAALTSDGKVQSFGSVATAGCSDSNPYDWSGNSCVVQGGQTQVDIWDPSVVRTVATAASGLLPNATYTDLFCSMQVQMPNRRATMTVGGDDGLGGNSPNDSAIGVTSYTTFAGLRNEAPMNYPRWYPTGTTTPDGTVVVQGGALKGGPSGPGVLTPEIYDPTQGNSWRLLTGATSAQAYGDGVPGEEDENRWWYPRAFVAPTNGNIFNISGTQMFELDPSGNGTITMRGKVGDVGNQGDLGNPVGATSTATMYRPGKILQVGGGTWSNGGGGVGARAGFTVDITDGTANPVLKATSPMKYARHWPTSTVMPDGNVIVTGGSRNNNGNDTYVTNAEIWNPDTDTWTEVEVPYEHARLYHSISLLLPDGRVMIGGGGTPGPRNYTDVEYYSPAYLFDGDEPATRPQITNVPKRVGYNGSFTMTSDTAISRVTLVRNGSVTHGFNNDQNFQELTFSQSGGTVSINAPVNPNFAPPGAYMVFLWSADGTPSMGKIVQIDPQVKLDAPAPKVVDQFEYPRLPVGWETDNAQTSFDVAPGNGRMSPWEVQSQVQLIRAKAAGMGGLGLTGYHLSTGASGELTRTIQGLDVGQEYRLSIRYARDSRSAGTAPGTANLTIGNLTGNLSAGAELSSQNAFGTYVGTFTATDRRMPLTIAAGASDAGVVLDDLVIVGTKAGASDVPVQYQFEEGSGQTAANSGTDSTVGAATLVGTTGWSPNGVDGGALDLKGGPNANTVDLPDNLLQGEADFTTAFWVRPDTKANWINLFHIGDGLEGAGSFFQIQMQTDAAPGGTGLAATFKKKGSSLQERIYATPTTDVVANQWNHVAFTRQGSTGTLYLNGVEIAKKDDLTITMADVGPTTNNWLGRNGYPDPSFDGLMDDVRVYTSALTGSDIAGMYADGAALNTTTTVSVSPESPSPFEAPITVSATVKDSANANPTGTAELWINGAREGSAVTVTDGAVSFPAVTLPPKTHQIEVRFIAAAGWRDSTKTVSHTVARPPVGSGVPVHYKFDEGSGTTSVNSGSDPAIGDAVLQGGAGWVPSATYGAGVDLPGETAQVKLPNDITFGMTDQATVSTWIRPTNLPNWTTHVQIGKDTSEFLLLQSETENGTRGFGVTLRKNGGDQYRVLLPGTTDLPLNQWTQVTVTLGPSPTGGGTTVKVYFNGQLQAGGTGNNIPVSIGDVGDGGTTANFLANGSWGDPRPTEQQDDFRLYGYELDATEVLALYNGTTNVSPVGVADSYSTVQDVTLNVAAPGVLGNDTDAEGNALTAGDVSQPDNGVVSLAANGSLTYVPDADFSGTDTFTYRANDGTSKSAATTVTITVTEEPNTAPTAEPDAYGTVAGEAISVAAPGVMTNDTDADGDALTATRTSTPVNGTVTLQADGSFTYKPDDGFVGKDQFTYTVSDGTATSTPAIVAITVKPAGGTGGGPLTSAVAGAMAPVTYGKAGTLVASVAPAAATGKVEVLQGGDLIASGVLASGRATLVLPAKSLLPGTHQLTLRYAGDDDHRSSSSTVEVTVDKVVPRMTVKAPSRVEKGTSPKVSVILRAPDDVPVTGTVSIAIKGGRTITGTLDDGRVVIKLPKVRRKTRLTVTYQGSGLAESVVDEVTIRIRR